MDSFGTKPRFISNWSRSQIWVKGQNGTFCRVLAIVHDGWILIFFAQMFILARRCFTRKIHVHVSKGQRHNLDYKKVNFPQVCRMLVPTHSFGDICHVTGTDLLRSKTRFDQDRRQPGVLLITSLRSKSVTATVLYHSTCLHWSAIPLYTPYPSYYTEHQMSALLFRPSLYHWRLSLSYCHSRSVPLP